MFVWPDKTKLSPCTVDLGDSTEVGVTRTNMDSGKPRQVQRTTTGWRTKTVNWEFTNEEYAVFQAILKYKLSNGVDWFEMALPNGDPADAEEEDFQILVVRFVEGKYRASYKDVMHWKVSATLETEQYSPMSEEDLDTYLGL